MAWYSSVIVLKNYNFTMYYSAMNMSLQSEFEIRKNRDAFFYTATVVALILLICIFFTLPGPAAPAKVAEDLIEVNLGNDMEGIGEEQPLVKGEMNAQPSQPDIQPQRSKQSAADDAASDPTNPDEKDKEAAAVTKPVVHTPDAPVIDKPITPVKTNKPAVVMAPPVPKPQKPIATYQGPGNGKGNGADQDNGYRMQGNNPNGKGDAGTPTGKADSYGTSPGGRSGGPKVIRGNRKIIKYYSFTGDLEKATIYAIIKVNPAGIGTFVGFDKNSSTRSQAYANAINNYLRNVQFDKSDDESNITVQFNFNVN
ncbi:MAG: hypothetical protein ABJA78_06455 [Ferruginibacter sp.]